MNELHAAFKNLKSLIFELNKGLQMRDEKLNDIGDDFSQLITIFHKNGFISGQVYEKIQMIQDHIEKRIELDEVPADQEHLQMIGDITNYFLARFYHYL